jgi:hypothetical protein
MSRPMRPSEAEGEPTSSLLTVEAETAEEALERISAELGPDARIVAAERVRRGGIAGFFAKEMVQLTAERQGAGASTLARLSAEAARRASALSSFSRSLERAMEDPGGRERAPSPEPEAQRPAAVARPHAEPRRDLGPVAWELDALVRIGLPFALIEHVAKLRPQDDLDWIRAISGWASPYCRGLPEGPFLLAGPRAPELAGALGLPHVRCPELPTAGGSVGLAFDPACADLAWLAQAQADRWVHAVVGGEGWEAVRDWTPKAVSWIGAEAVSEALHLCMREGLPLGYGTVAQRVVRVEPLEVALAVRELVGRR